MPLKLKPLFSAILSLSVFVLTLEVSARVHDRIAYQAPLLGRYAAANLRGSEGGVPHNIPNARFEKWRNNNLGFRGPDLAPEKRSQVTRVVCLGASEGYGLYESEGKEWPAQLRQLLTNRNFEVVNASVVGLSVTQYEPYLRKHILPLKPDILVASVNPFFYAARMNRPSRSASPKGPTHLSPEDLRAIPKIKQALKQALATHLPEALKAYKVRTLQAELKELEKARLKGRKPLDAVPEQVVLGFAEELEKLVRFCAERNIKLVLTTYPSMIGSRNLESHPEIFLDSRRFSIEYSLAGMVDVLDKLNEVVRSCAARNGIKVIDLAALVPKSTDFFGDNVHYTDRGAQTVARSVAQEALGVPAPKDVAAKGGGK